MSSKNARNGESTAPVLQTRGYSAVKAAGTPPAMPQRQEMQPLPVKNTNEAPAAQDPLLPHVETIEELRAALIEQLQVEHTMLATALSKTLNWDKKDDTLCISVHTPYEAQQLQREKTFLAQKVSALYRHALKIHIELEEKKETTQAVVPARVEMVLRNFKGTIIDIQKNVIQEIPEDEEEE